MTDNTLMSTNNEHTESVPISSGLAARALSARLGESMSIWQMRLANWRRPGRGGPLKPMARSGTVTPSYDLSEVNEYIERMEALGKVVKTSMEGLDATKATAVSDTADGRTFVKLLWNTTLSQGAFSLSMEAALALADSLQAAAVRSQELKVEAGA